MRIRRRNGNIRSSPAVVTYAGGGGEVEDCPQPSRPWLKSGLLVLSSETVARISSLGVLVLLARGLTLDVYGAYAMLAAAAAIVFAIADFGMTAWSLKHFSQQGGLHDFRRALALKVSLALAAAASLWIGSAIFYLPLNWHLITGYLFFQFASSVAILSRAAARAQARGAAELLARTVERTFLFAAIATVLVFGSGATGFGVAFAMAGGVSLVVHAWLAIAGGVTGATFYNGPIRKLSVFEILTQSAPFGLSTFFVLIYFKADTIMLGLLQGTTEAAHYAMAYVVVEAMGMLPAAITTAAWPTLVRAARASQQTQLETLFHLLLALGLPIGAGLLFVGGDLLRLMFGVEGASASLALLVLVPAMIASFANYSIGTLLQTNGNERVVVRLTALAAFVNILLNFALIPLYGIPGAAAATLASELLFFSGAARHGTIRPSVRTFAKLVAPALLATGVMAASLMLLSSFFLELTTSFQLLLQIIVGGMVYLAILFILDVPARKLILELIS